MSEESDEAYILYSNGGNPVSRPDLLLSFSKSNNRHPLPDSLGVDAIDSIWSERYAANPTLWNGSKFRLASITKNKDGSVVWDLGLTDYKDFLGTNLSKMARELHERGRADYENAQAYMADPLGVGSLLLTSDDQIVLLKRSMSCAEAPGLYDIPGGHPEPQEIMGKVSIRNADYSLFTEDVIREEVFSSILREIHDEVNLPAVSLDQPLLLGVAINTLSGGRPSSEFIIRTSLTGEEVVKLYHEGSQLEADESTDIKLVPHSQIPTLRDSTLWSVLAPSAKGCFLLYVDYLNSL